MNDQHQPHEEMDALLAALAAGELTPTQSARMEALIQSDRNARRQYLSYVHVDGMLHWHYGVSGASGVSGVSVDSDDNKFSRPSPIQNSPLPSVQRHRLAARFTRWLVPLAAAAGIIIAINTFGTNRVPVPETTGGLIALNHGALPPSRYESVSLPGWRVLVPINTAHRVNGSIVEFESGEVYVNSEPFAGTRAQLIIRTPGGDVEAQGTRFYVTSRQQEETMKLSDIPTQLKQALQHATHVIVMAGIINLTNPMGTVQVVAGEQAQSTTITAPQKLQQEGHYKEALDIYKKLLVDPKHKGEAAGKDLLSACRCMAELGRFDYWDALVEETITAHPEDFYVLHAAAQGYAHSEHGGFIVDGRFHRGWHIKNSRYVNAYPRDRIRALQLFEQAVAKIDQVTGPTAKGAFYLNFAHLFQGPAWQMQILTDIALLPDYDAPKNQGRTSLAPVTTDGKPVLFHIPDNWTKAANDGERWRWLVAQAKQVDPALADAVDFQFASFLHSQFGVGTLGSLVEKNTDADPTSNRYSVKTLGDDETLARLATGVQRLKLPAEFNHLAIYKAIAARAVLAQPPVIKDLTYKYYEGDWDNLPDFSKLTLVKSGEMKDGMFDISILPRTNSFGVVYEGTLQVPHDGEYTFVLDSDDGSSLEVGGLKILHDGRHGTGSPNSGTVKLKKGDVSIRAAMFEKGGAEALHVSWSGPGVPLQSLSKMTDVSIPEQALNTLASIYENRQQRARAAAAWQDSIQKFGDQNEEWKTKRHAQIVGNWCQLDGETMYAAGSKPRLFLSYRNAQNVGFSAHRVNLDLYIQDLKAYLKSNPENPDEDRVSLDAIGMQLVEKDQKKYLGDLAEAWSMKLTPKADHWDDQVEIDIPIDAAGLYLLQATATDGNVSRRLVWLTDTVIVCKAVHNNQLYFVADARTGAPIPHAQFEFFGYRNEYDRPNKRRFTSCDEFAAQADANGLLIPDPNLFQKNNRWMAIAKDEATGRYGIHGFESERRRTKKTDSYNTAKAYVVTDRPLYRPDQTVKIHSWIRQARYDLDDVSVYGGKTFELRIHDPQGKELLKKSLKTDEFGGISTDLRLDEEATLGRYSITIVAYNFTDPATGKKRKEDRLGHLGFQVEEYKKPEYEVVVEAPTEPAVLGDTIAATIKATYYFGAPVSNAKVTFTVTRQDHNSSWVPPRPWDWFYGKGYAWFGHERTWYPGWDDWGCPPPGWWQAGPEEIVQENTVDIGADGTVKVAIDTQVAKALFGDSDHRYTISAEVVDQSRRSIHGTGSVIAARKPFKVYTWFNGGHYAVGDEMVGHFYAQTPDGKPVTGKGKAVLFEVTYDDNEKPSETKVQEWAIDTDETGRATLSIKAHKAGQYRLSYQLMNGKGYEREGAALVQVRGKEFDGTGYKFNDLELTLDKAEYKPGERAKILINTNQPNSTVYVFIRPTDGVYAEPQILKLSGKNVVYELDITQADLPNAYVEVVTISKGHVFSTMKQVVVPPEKRVLDVAIIPSETRYKPGAKGTVRIRLTDSVGRPFSGRAVLSVYDKALEYIANEQAPDIKAFFWQWQRTHHIHHSISVDRDNHELLKKNEIGIGYGAGIRPEYYEAVLDIRSPDWSLLSLTRPIVGVGILNSLSRMGGILQPAGPSFIAGRANDPFVLMGYNQALVPSNGVDRGFRGSEPEPVIRTNFADAAVWKTDITTDANGEAEIDIEMPDNLTTWTIKVWGLGHGTVVGQGTSQIITSKDLLVRLQAPRFFVEKDHVVLSANVHNYLDGERTVSVSLELDGDHLTAADKEQLTRVVTIPAKGEMRVDWPVTVACAGQALVRIKAVTNDDADAMAMNYPVYVHGALRTEAWSGVLRPNQDTGKLSMQVPQERRPDQSKLEIRYSPSVALSLIDALPYLAAYEHKNSESVLNRFLPAVITRKVLTDMGVDLAKVKDTLTNLNPQEIGAAPARAAQWQKTAANPVFDPEAIDKLVTNGLRDLYGMQKNDGGFSWHPRSDQSDVHATALVVHGMIIAQQNGVPVIGDNLKRAITWLVKYQNKELQKLTNAPTEKDLWKAHVDDSDAFVYLVLAENSKPNPAIRDLLYRDRLKLSRSSQAHVALALHIENQAEQRDVIIRNLRQFLVIDNENQTAYLDMPENYSWWRWYDNQIETQAAFLRLLVATEPKGEAASGLVKYLINNRKHATYWHGTRDTANCIEAIAEFVQATGENKPDMKVTVKIDGKVSKTVAINQDTLFTFDNRVELTGKDVTTGEHTVEFFREGTGPLYYNSYLTTFSLEDVIKQAGLEIKINRSYFTLVPDVHTIKTTDSSGAVVEQRVENTKRIRINPGDQLSSGDLIEVELIIDSKNDYEHVLFQDFKPAGFEAVEQRSGNTWNGLGAYMELRDEKVTFQVHRVRRGTHTIRYNMRAEIPGTFSALPARADGMYAPELRANSDEMKMTVGN